MNNILTKWKKTQKSQIKKYNRQKEKIRDQKMKLKRQKEKIRD